jgi:hypothetical protein
LIADNPQVQRQGCGWILCSGAEDAYYWPLVFLSYAVNTPHGIRRRWAPTSPTSCCTSCQHALRRRWRGAAARRTGGADRRGHVRPPIQCRRTLSHWRVRPHDLVDDDRGAAQRSVAVGQGMALARGLVRRRAAGSPCSQRSGQRACAWWAMAAGHGRSRARALGAGRARRRVAVLLLLLRLGIFFTAVASPLSLTRLAGADGTAGVRRRARLAGGVAIDRLTRLPSDPRE